MNMNVRMAMMRVIMTGMIMRFWVGMMMVIRQESSLSNWRKRQIGTSQTNRTNLMHRLGKMWVFM